VYEGAIAFNAAIMRLYEGGPFENGYQQSYISQGSTVPIVPGFSDSTNVTTFNPLHYTTTYPHPQAENAYGVPAFHAPSNAALFWQWVAPWYLGATVMDAPDSGVANVDDSMWQSSTGRMIVLLNASNSTQVVPVPLGTCSYSGQNMVLVQQVWHNIMPLLTITAGTTTETVTMPQGSGAAILCPQTFAGTLHEPTVSFRLADVSGATSVTIKCGQDAYTLPLAGIVNLGSGSGGFVTATLPYDSNMWAPNGQHLYCTPVYLGSGNVPLAGNNQSAQLQF
jgi:hypothetical protein